MYSRLPGALFAVVCRVNLTYHGLSDSGQTPVMPLSSLRAPLNSPAVICPMEYCLPLLPPAAKVARPAVVRDLGNMSPYRPPSSDLAFVVRAPSSQVVPAVPLKPPPRVLVIDPSPLPPLGERQRGIYAEQVQSGIMPLMTHPRFLEPRCREFLDTIGHVFAAEDAQLEHLFRGEIRREARDGSSSPPVR